MSRPVEADAAASARRPVPGGLRGVARGSTANLAGAGVSALATLGLTMAVTHGLPRDRAGVFFATTSLFMLATTIGQLGTNTGLVYFLSRSRAMRLTGAQRLLFRTATRPVLAVALVMGVALFVFATDLARWINPEHVSVSADYLRVLAVFIPLAGLENVTLAGTRGLGTMRPNVVVEQLGRPSLQLALVLLSVTVLDGRALGLAWAFAYLPAAVLAVSWWNRLVSDDGTPAASRTADVASLRREFWRFTSPRALASVAQMAMQRLDIVLVAALAGAVPAALYTAATRFLVVGQMGNRAISLAVQPRLGESLALGDLRQTRHFYQTATAWLILVTWPMYLLFVVFGERLLAIFGRGYGAGHEVLLLLSLTMLFATACGMVDMVLNMAGRTSWNLINVALSLGVQLGVDLWLIPDHGILGAAIGWAAGIACANVVPLLQIGLTMRLHPFGRTTGTAAVLAGGCFGLVPQAVLWVVGPGWTAVAVSVVVAGGAYAALLWRLRGTLHLTALAGLRRGRRGEREDAR
ncbi:MAG TPA: polysaccharide biosynthesis C-terminal domain-containing protein [Actinomycetales bacterium]|nr:polysaccharide biosynthesis C-terminal domain-containing protein [Actinomycetales bacterium]